MQKEDLISSNIHFQKKRSTVKIKCFTCDFSESMNGISVNKSENVADSQTCPKV